MKSTKRIRPQALAVEASRRKAADEVNMQLCSQSISLTMTYGNDVTRHLAVLLLYSVYTTGHEQRVVKVPD